MTLRALEAASYEPSPLHGPDREFRETNCYIDLWIELIHALGLEPRACLGVTLASTFEVDQWTFYKPRHGELDRLYGIRVEELSLWRPLMHHAQAQVQAGRVPLIEMDSYFLPDTSGTDYQTQHVKTTIGVASLDPASRKMTYFHNAGFFAVEGADFESLWRPPAKEHPGYLPPYCEIAVLDKLQHLPEAELKALSSKLARRHLQRRPSDNPIRAHQRVLDEQLAAIAEGGMPTYHVYCFSVIRQLGSNFELAASYLRWLGGDAAESAASSFSTIASTAKTIILKLARVAAAGRKVDLSAAFDTMAEAWDQGMKQSERALAP